MARSTILLYPNQELTLRSEPVGIEWARSGEFQQFLKDMIETMVWFRGVGLSAIQLGVQDRVFVMRTKQSILALVDPEIESLDGDPELLDEGCLSVPGVTERVLRFPEVELSALDVESGNRKRYLMEGVEAQCVQHEMDHLDGKMFTDGYGAVKRDIVKRKIKKEVRQNPLFKELT